MDVGSDIQQHLFVGEQGGASSGVEEKDFFIFGESAFADVIDQACHSFSSTPEEAPPCSPSRRCCWMPDPTSILDPK